MILPIDYHLHTKRCGHASGDMRSYVEQAISLGLQEIGFSDHLPLLHTIDSTLTMSWDDLPYYLADVQQLKQAYQEIKIKLGIEVDYIPNHHDELVNILGNYDFDYIMGSIHFVDGWGIDDRRYFDNYANYDIDDLYQRYFKLLGEAAASGLFDILAHPDLIKKYNMRPSKDIADLYLSTAKSIKEADIAVEISSAGLRKPVKEIYPRQEFLNICAAADIPVTVGSDAHHPDEVGQNFNLLLQSLQIAGYNEVVIFTGRQRKTLKI